jgi:hypothetical protein
MTTLPHPAPAPDRADLRIVQHPAQYVAPINLNDPHARGFIAAIAEGLKQCNQTPSNNTGRPS